MYIIPILDVHFKMFRNKKSPTNCRADFRKAID